MSMSNQQLNENDFESPGYEYLRSYQNMSNLYYKLVALNYQKEFCSLYKCPPIHKYYFSFPNKNTSEQQFLFACLCAWLIKDKCQMNLQPEPEEYEDPDIVIGVILEAIQLLLTSEDETTKRDLRNPISFPPGRLKHGFGPEIIWTMNILADRALELMLNSSKDQDKRMKLIFNNRSNSIPDSSNRQLGANSIIIGQPFVGGGLTTRPLGSYQVDDTSLLFDDVETDTTNCDLSGLDARTSTTASSTDLASIDPKDWYLKVEKVARALETARLIDESGRFEIWRDYLESAIESKKSIQEFVYTSKSLLEATANRVARHLQVISGREKFIQTNLRTQIAEFLKVWRQYSEESTLHDNLSEQVNSQTDRFENQSDRLKKINAQIESRIKELNDGSKLRELESMINQLKEENMDFDVKIGLLLTVYAKLQAKIVTSSNSSSFFGDS